MSDPSGREIEPARAELTLHADRPGARIHENVYGHFAEHLGRGIYEGIWVGETSPIENLRGIRSDVVRALKAMGVPVLRWPGGCFADEYHWRDGIGPRGERPRMINTHWGGVVENNHFGTHEFMDLCEQLGAEPYVCGNLGSGSIREMMEWVEYMTSDADSPMANLRRRNGRTEPWRLRYFGVGNESWGCGGNMRPEFYADQYRRYATFVKSYAGNRIERIACGANGADYAWTEVLMGTACRHLDGLSLHHYTLPTDDWTRKGSALDFGEDEWHATLARALAMDELVTNHSAIMDRHDPERRVSLVIDEWGAWYDPTPGTNPGFLEQENTLRDALVAAVSLNVFNRHAERVRMANLAQTVNVLQCVLRTDGAKLVLTPTYHVFEMYRPHRGAVSIPVSIEAPEYRYGGRSLPMLHASASRGANGRFTLSVVNLDPTRSAVTKLAGCSGKPAGRILTAADMDAHNGFCAPHAVGPRPFDGFVVRDGGLSLSLPEKSVLVLEFP